MNHANAAGCMAAGDAPDAGLEKKAMTLRWKSIPWARIVVDALLVAGILLASSSLLTVR